MKLLNLGCGQKFHKDWINIDFVSRNKGVKAYDLLKGIPMSDESVDVVYHSHVLEHFSKEDGKRFLKECFRVLKKGGIIRIVVPDLEVIVKEYLQNLNEAIEGKENAGENYEWITLELLDQLVRNRSGGEMVKYLQQEKIPNEPYVWQRIGVEGEKIRNEYLHRKEQKSSIKKTIPKRKTSKIKFSRLQKIFSRVRKYYSKYRDREKRALRIGRFRLRGEIHQWMYDRYSLPKLLKETGFKEIIVTNAFESGIKNWENFELDIIKGKVRKPDSLFIEAKKI